MWQKARVNVMGVYRDIGSIKMGRSDPFIMSCNKSLTLVVGSDKAHTSGF